MRIGGIFLELLLRDGDFHERMTRAGNRLERWSAGAKQNLGQFAAYTSASLAVGAAATAAGVANAISQVDKLAKSSDRLGIASDRLAEFGYAGGLAGVEMETLEKAVRTLNKNAVEAVTGNAALAKSFEDVGISAENFVGLPTEEKLRVIIDKLGQIENPARRAAAAQDLLGKSGYEMQTLIAGGAEELNKAAAEARLFGLSISRVDAAKIEAAADGMDRLKSAGTGFFQQLAIEAAPAITKATERVVQLIEEMGGIESVSDRAFDAIVSGASTAVGVVSKLAAGLGTVYAGLLQISSLAAAGGSAIAAKVGAYGVAGDLAGRSAGLQSDADSIASKVLSLLDADLGGSLKKFVADARGRAAPQVPALSPEVDQSASAVEALAVPIERAASAADTFAESMTEATKAMMTVEDIARLGSRTQRSTSSGNVSLADRVLALRAKADRAEADARFTAADRLRARADVIEDRLKRRTVIGADGRPLSLQPRGTDALAPGGDTINPTPVVLEPDAQAMRAQADADKAARETGMNALQQQIIDDQAAKAEREAQMNRTQQRVIKEGGVDFGSLGGQIQNLIGVLTNLPSQIGVA